MVSMKRRGVVGGSAGVSARFGGRGTREALAAAAEAPLGDARILELLHARIAARQSLGLVVGVLEGRRQRVVAAGRMGRS